MNRDMLNALNAVKERSDAVAAQSVDYLKATCLPSCQLLNSGKPHVLTICVHPYSSVANFKLLNGSSFPICQLLNFGKPRLETGRLMYQQSVFIRVHLWQTSKLQTPNTQYPD